ncbi:exocyst complex component 1-like isoform 2-T2 [Spheniscus humboldti]
MASLWSSLEKDACNPQKKRLLETVRVWKSGKMSSILCVVGRQRPPEDGKDTAETESQEELSVYQEMTPKEAADVLKLMEEYKPLVNNSVAFAEQLSNNLHVLNEANLRAIISSEKRVTQLMSSIDEALAEVARVEETLQIYDELLGSVKQQMDHIHRENSLLHRIISNKTRLMDEILFLTTHLNLSREHCDALSQADLSSPSRVKACIAAAEALSGCMNIQIQPGYRKLQSVAEQLIMFETLKQNFENSFINHITSIFKLQGNAQVPALGQPVNKLSAPSHGLHHEELVPYAPLMAWLRNANPVLFYNLPKVYAQNLRRLYDREVEAFFEQAKTFLLGRRKGGLQERLEKLMVMGSRQPALCSLPGSSEGQEDTPGKGNVIKVLGQVLRELQPLCTAEQQFIEKFFQLSQDATELQVLEASATEGGASMASPEDPPCTKPQSQLEEPTTQLLSEIFSCLEPELRGFLEVCSKVHPFSCLQVLVTLNDSIFEMLGSSSTLRSSFLNTVLGNMRFLAKSRFNKCIETLCKEIEEAKMPSKMKDRILPSVSLFEEFVNFSEEVFRTARQRGDLHEAHLRLASSVFSSSEYKGWRLDASVRQASGVTSNQLSHQGRVCAGYLPPGAETAFTEQKPGSIRQIQSVACQVHGCMPHWAGPSCDRAETHVLSFESNVNLPFPTTEGVAPHYRSDDSSYKRRGLGSGGSRRATPPETPRHIGRERGVGRARQVAFSRILCCPSWCSQLFVSGGTLLPSLERTRGAAEVTAPSLRTTDH